MALLYLYRVPPAKWTRNPANARGPPSACRLPNRMRRSQALACGPTQNKEREKKMKSGASWKRKKHRSARIRFTAHIPRHEGGGKEIGEIAGAGVCGDDFETLSSSKQVLYWRAVPLGARQTCTPNSTHDQAKALAHAGSLERLAHSLVDPQQRAAAVARRRGANGRHAAGGHGADEDALVRWRQPPMRHSL